MFFNFFLGYDCFPVRNRPFYFFSSLFRRKAGKTSFLIHSLRMGNFNPPNGQIYFPQLIISDNVGLAITIVFLDLQRILVAVSAGAPAKLVSAVCILAGCSPLCRIPFLPDVSQLLLNMKFNAIG